MNWHPTQFFRSSPVPSPFALLILNQPINENAFAELYQHASFTICADGGANQFYELMKGLGKETTNLPNAIVGDLDSITTQVRTHYSTLGVPVVEDGDQYSTDFTKCLRYLRGHEQEIVSGRYVSSTTATATAAANGRSETRLEIVILGGLGGRVDQAFSQIHHLYCMSLETESSSSSSSSGSAISGGGNLYLISEESITFVLKRGKNVIHVPGTRYQSQGRSEREEGDYYLQENAGIIPVTGPARITTRGFEWDVKDWHSSIGGQLSTSNHIRAGKVEVGSEEAVLFTIELADGLKGGGRRR